MKTVLVCILLIILLIAGVLLYKDIYVERKFRKLAARKYQVVGPLMQKLASNAMITDIEIMGMIREPGIRFAIFWLLETSGRRDLFPLEYFTNEKGAESALVNWLEFPTELGTAPAEIELMEKIILNDHANQPIDYYVFKYRSAPPHWGAKWMMGVSGPYVAASMPYTVPQRVFSRFNEAGSTSPEQEARWVHENIHG